MAELQFHKNRNRPRPVKETKITKPREKYSSAKESNLVTHHNKMGRPRKNKKYGSIRTDVNNVMLLDALQNTLGYDTQDDILHHLLIQARNSLSDAQETMLDTFLKVYRIRYSNHHK